MNSCVRAAADALAEHLKKKNDHNGQMLLSSLLAAVVEEIQASLPDPNILRKGA